MSIFKSETRLAASVLAIFFLSLVVPVLYGQDKELKLTATPEALALFVQGREKIENLEDPGTLFEQAVQKDPNFAIAYLYAGRSNQEIRKNLEKALALSDKVTPGEKIWILSVRDQLDGNVNGRKANLEQLAKLHPGDKRVHSMLAQFYRGIGDDTAALKHFQDTIRIDKNYAPAYNELGYAYIAMGKYADAENAFKTYIKLIPKNPNPYDSYAELLMRMGKFDDSIVQYNKALAMDPTFFNSYRGIGNNYVYKGDFNKARESYQMMYDKAPDDAGRDLALAATVDSYLAEGNIDKALEANDRRLQMAEKAGDIASMAGIHSLAGFILLESGKFDDAEKHFDMADKYRSDPSMPVGRMAVRKFNGMLDRSRLMIARGELDAARKQLDMMGQNVGSLNNPFLERMYNETYGILEYKQKNYPKAIERLAKADQTSPYVWYYQAAAYDGSGDKKMATTLYGKVAALNQLDDPGFSIVRPRAVARTSELATTMKK